MAIKSAMIPQAASRENLGISRRTPRAISMTPLTITSAMKREIGRHDLHSIVAVPVFLVKPVGYSHLWLVCRRGSDGQILTDRSFLSARIGRNGHFMSGSMPDMPGARRGTCRIG